MGIGAGGPPGSAPLRRRHAFPLPHGLPEARLIAAVRKAGFSAGEALEEGSSALYLDTQDGRLFKAGLRLARVDDGRLCLLDEGHLVAEADAPGVAALPTEGPLADRVVAAVRGLKLIAHLLVESRERVWPLTGAAGEPARLAIASWSFASPHRRETAKGPRLLVVEADEGEPSFRLTAAMSHLAMPLPGPPDPLVTGLLALGQPLPGAPVPPELKLVPTDDMVRAGRKVLARQAHKMWANSEGTILDLDPEYLHDLRVATRRARFALRLLFPFFGRERCQALRDELRWIGGLLGTVRDLDVFIDRLEHDMARCEIDPATVERSMRLLHRRRDEARRELVPALESTRFRASIDGLRTLAPDPAAFAEAAEPPPSTEAPDPAAAAEADAERAAEVPALEAPAPPLAADVAPRLVARTARRVLRWEKKLDHVPASEDLHALRIAFKGLRYTCEFFVDLLSEEERKVIRAMVELQDCLGEHQDAVVAQAELEKLVEQRVAARASADELLALGSLVQVQRERRAAQRGQFDELWSKTRGRVRKLRDAAG